MIGSAQEAAAFARVRRRLVPFLFVLYVVSYLDRVNVGFAALQMNRDLGFSAAVYGFGAGIFFLSYVLCEVPSNLVMVRVGARRWIARIMITWGVASAAMMFVRGDTSFYAMRFVLGAAEAGFFPGMVLYLTQWFPAAERARTIASFMTATALAGVIGGPMSAALLSLDGVLGFRGWQWLFLLEGAPAVVLGAIVLWVLPDGPDDARWLTPDERRLITARLADDAARAPHAHTTLGAALATPRLWGLAFLYLAIVIALYGVGFFAPQILSAATGRSPATVALLSAIPYLFAAVAMVVVGVHSDRVNERRWHVAGATLVAAVGLACTGMSTHPLVAILFLSMAAVGIWSTLGPFWAMPAAFLRGTAAAGGIAVINSVGNVGGFIGPGVMGFVKDQTGDFTYALFVLAAAMVVAAALALGLREQPSLVGQAGS
jgi:ACS family tartrate transporter-like MFS transporter